MHKILKSRTYFLLHALHFSDYISPSSGAIATQQPHVTAYTGIYQTRCTAYKVAPDDGLIQSETCRASNGK